MERGSPGWTWPGSGPVGQPGLAPLGGAGGGGSVEGERGLLVWGGM